MRPSMAIFGALFRKWTLLGLIRSIAPYCTGEMTGMPCISKAAVACRASSSNAQSLLKPQSEARPGPMTMGARNLRRIVDRHVILCEKSGDHPLTIPR